MNLPDMHRSGQRPQWEEITQEDWNDYQRRAAATHGWDTPGNRESFKGFAGSLAGLYLIDHGHTVWGTLALGYGRVQDLRDGKTAKRTGTMGPKGEAIDAVGDGVMAAVAAPILAKNNIISDTERNIVIANMVGKFITAGVAKTSGVELHATRSAKVGAFLSWSGFGIQLLGEIANKRQHENLSEPTKRAGRYVTYAGLALSTTEALGYFKKTFLK